MTEILNAGEYQMCPVEIYVKTFGMIKKIIFLKNILTTEATMFVGSTAIIRTERKQSFEKC